MSLRRSIFTLSAVSTLALAACGGGDSPEDSTPSSSSTSTTATSVSSSSSSSAPEDNPSPTAGSTPEAVEPAPAVDSAPTATCATDFTLYQPGTTFYSDGTSGYTASCQQQMEDAMEASGQFPDYPFGNVDPNWTEDDVLNRGDADIKSPEVAADQHAGQSWWAECISVNDATYCRENDPWQQ